MRRRVRAIVTGRVQGVSYRASTVFEARRLGLSGWVRNCNDGTVELECEGDGARVATLLAWCERGPAGAVVTRVSIDD
ncbi:MAG TPA: acylphosphatase, partial [Kofleriaceae bacterium]|nr:acylphosphatase [Kofleriaceae bacterium]